MSHITHQYVDTSGDDHIEIAREDGHTIFVVIEDDTITVHSSMILETERPHGAVNKVEVKIQK